MIPTLQLLSAAGHVPSGWGGPLALGDSLIEWWDSSSGITVATGVSAWVGKKAGFSAVQATGAAQPLYSATSFNGSPGLTFDGTDDQLTCTDAGISVLPDGAEPGEMWGVVQQDALAADATQRFLVNYGSANASCRRIGRNSSGIKGAILLVGNGTAVVSSLESTVLFNTRHVIRGQFGATSSTVYIDGTAAAAASAVPASNIVRLRIGSSSATTATLFWSGIVRDVIITTELTESQAQTLQSFLMGRR